MTASLSSVFRTCPAVMLLIISGCTFVSQQATIDPEVEVARSDTGKGRTVALSVQDERADKTLGRRGTGAMSGAAITSDQDVAEIFLEEISKGLAARGFQPVSPSEKADISLLVELRELKYSTSMGFWTGGVHMNAAMKVEVETKAGTYEEFYRVDEEQRKFFVNFADENEAIINAAVSDLIQKFFDDRKLAGFIAQ